MFLKFILGLVAMVVAFFGIVAIQPSDYRISREIKISAPIETVFGNVNDLHKFDAWNPWSKLDPASKGRFEGHAAGVGAKYLWEGNTQIGACQMTIVESIPSSAVRMKLEYAQPVASTAVAEFTFKSENGHTLVSWSNSGKSAYIHKVFSVFVNMDKMVG